MKWDSKAFWAAIKWDYAAVNADGRVYVYEDRPYQGSAQWSGRHFCSLECLDLTDVPPAEEWEGSLIVRPYAWQEPDEDTPTDAKVWGRKAWGKWYRGHYAWPGFAWADGGTSWTREETVCSWEQLLLADPSDPSRVPPANWRPKSMNSPGEE